MDARLIERATEHLARALEQLRVARADLHASTVRRLADPSESIVQVEVDARATCERLLSDVVVAVAVAVDDLRFALITSPFTPVDILIDGPVAFDRAFTGPRGKDT